MLLSDCMYTSPWGIFLINDWYGAYCVWCHSWSGELGVSKKTNWASHEDTSRKKYFFLASASDILSGFLHQDCDLLSLMMSFNVEV